MTAKHVARWSIDNFEKGHHLVVSAVRNLARMLECVTELLTIVWNMVWYVFIPLVLFCVKHLPDVPFLIGLYRIYTWCLGKSSFVRVNGPIHSFHKKHNLV